MKLQVKVRFSQMQCQSLSFSFFSLVNAESATVVAENECLDHLQQLDGEEKEEEEEEEEKDEKGKCKDVKPNLI